VFIARSRQEAFEDERGFIAGLKAMPEAVTGGGSAIKAQYKTLRRIRGQLKRLFTERRKIKKRLAAASLQHTSARAKNRLMNAMVDESSMIVSEALLKYGDLVH
jgi:hypothetical protein